jgi:hypothetical protein
MLNKMNKKLQEEVDTSKLYQYNSDTSTWVERIPRVQITSDVEIGAVEIKNSTDDTRAVVGANGLYVDVRTIQAGTNFIGRSGASAFKAMANFTRATGATPYTIDDSICDSTSTPTIMSYDLANFGAVVGQQYMITNARVIVSTKGSAGSLNANIWIFNTTFAGTADNAELSIDDATSQTGGIIIPCYNTYSNALNHRCVSDPGQWMGKLAAADTKLYFVVQAANAWTPASADRIDVIFEGILL